MNKMVYAIWLGDGWFTSGSESCLQVKSGGMPEKTFSDCNTAVAVYRDMVNRGIIIHKEGNSIVRINSERV